MMNKTLSDYAFYVTDRIPVKNLTSKTFVGVDNMLPNRGGITESEYIPFDGTATNFKKGDILIGNIRPYFKKIWLAEFEGGCSNDVLCIRTKGEVSPQFLYAVLSQDSFFKYDMSGSKGSKMPRGDANHLMRYPIIINKNMEEIGNFVVNLYKKIVYNNKINSELESMAKTLYDYWFLQFEFPNAEGKPYKSSGGKMVYNEQLKKEIPEGWEVKKLGELLTKQNRNFNYDKVVNTVDLSIMPTNSLSLNELNKSNLFDTNLFGLKKYDILFGSIRPYLKKACIAPCDGAVAGTVHCYIVNKESDYNFSLITLCSDNLFKFAINNSKGTKMPVVSSDDLLEYLVAYNEDMVKLFNSLNLKEVISNNIMQNQELTSLRDFLLPLLMNGQVTIGD